VISAASGCAVFRRVARQQHRGVVDAARSASQREDVIGDPLRALLAVTERKLQIGEGERAICAIRAEQHGIPGMQRVVGHLRRQRFRLNAQRAREQRTHLPVARLARRAAAARH